MVLGACVRNSGGQPTYVFIKKQHITDTQKLKENLSKIKNSKCLKVEVMGHVESRFCQSSFVNGASELCVMVDQVF